MPELDRFERTFGAGWRRAYRRARIEGASLEEVADILAGVLAKELRESDGVPGFREMERAVEEMVQESAVGFGSAGQEAEALIRAFAALERIVQDHPDHTHTKIASDVAKSMIVHIGEGPIALHFVERICNSILEHRFFANARQNLVAQDKLANYVEAQQWQSRVEQIMQPAITAIAEQISQNPDAKGLRAPNRIVKKESTSDLLHEDLTSVQMPNNASAGQTK